MLFLTEDRLPERERKRRIDVRAALEMLRDLQEGTEKRVEFVRERYAALHEHGLSAGLLGAWERWRMDLHYQITDLERSLPPFVEMNEDGVLMTRGTE
jgi:hypothetical protein